MPPTTSEQKMYHMIHLLTACLEKGWKWEREWYFRSPKGTLHDLSATNPHELDRVERLNLSLVENI